LALDAGPDGRRRLGQLPRGDGARHGRAQLLSAEREPGGRVVALRGGAQPRGVPRADAQWLQGGPVMSWTGPPDSRRRVADARRIASSVVGRRRHCLLAPRASRCLRLGHRARSARWHSPAARGQGLVEASLLMLVLVSLLMLGAHLSEVMEISLKS